MTYCPRPEKLRFRSAAEAKRYNRSFSIPNGRGGSHVKARLWPYLCKCGCYHLTTQNYDEQKRIREQIYG